MRPGARAVLSTVRASPFRSALAAALVIAAGAAGGGACGGDAGQTAPGASASTAPPPSAAPVSSATSPADSPIALEKVGGVIARTTRPQVVAVVDEDHLVVRMVDLAADPPITRDITLPGRPAQVIALADALLVTVRDPGLLLRLVPNGDDWKVAGTARLPADAWGVTVTPDGGRALVSSAWSRRVSAVDLSKLVDGAEVDPVWSVAVAREPRGIVVGAGGVAYVTHLVGADLTRLDGVAGAEAPAVKRVVLPASPLRAPSGKKLTASLGWAAALSEGGDRLFVARHAIGALGREAWFGAATVDVLLLPGDQPLSPVHQGNGMVYRSELAKEVESPDTKANLPADPVSPFVQPRDVRVRKSAGTLLVVGEGDGRLVELDALAIDPTLAVVARYDLAKDRDPNLGIPATCGAPAGLALSPDETTAYVFCRSTYDLAVVPLAEVKKTGTIDPKTAGNARYVKLGTDPLGDEGSVGRRIFYDAVDPIASGGLGCAGCHPEGRDDGFTWHEATFDTADGGTKANFVGSYEQVPDIAKTKGVPRQTPMLAARVSANGPYGWLAESKTLPDRIGASFGLHRWGGLPKHAQENVNARAGHLVTFLRRGLVPPALEARDLTEAEKRGKEIFESREAGCAGCHRAQTDFTDRTAYPLRKLPQRPGYDEDPKDAEFKTPSLRFVGGSEPYYHDGSAPTLELLIEQNGDRMGKTSHLSAEQRADLIAYLRTL
jgi:DNA-binding beta-propeller fold protein YncE